MKKYLLDTNTLIFLLKGKFKIPQKIKDMIMVTENQKDFENITGIRIENWVNRE